MTVIHEAFMKSIVIKAMKFMPSSKKFGKTFINRSRIKALKNAIKENYDVAIFDDGLQDYSIKHNVNLVCFNNFNWIGNGMTIPSGPLRENLNNLKNYNHVFLNGNGENLSNIKSKILSISPTINIHEGKYVPLNLKDFNLKNDYLAFSGIGNHNTFLQRDWSGLLAGAPGNVVLVRQQSAWNNIKLFHRSLGSITPVDH